MTQWAGPMLGQLSLALEELGWDADDDITVDIGGASVYERLMVLALSGHQSRAQ